MIDDKYLYSLYIIFQESYETSLATTLQIYSYYNFIKKLTNLPNIDEYIMEKAINNQINAEKEKVELDINIKEERKDSEVEFDVQIKKEKVDKTAVQSFCQIKKEKVDSEEEQDIRIKIERLKSEGEIDICMTKETKENDKVSKINIKEELDIGEEEFLKSTEGYNSAENEICEQNLHISLN